MKTTLNFPQISRTDAEIFEAIKVERETIGYYNLPMQDIEPMKKKLDSLNFTQKQVAVIGIGGSTLGTYAIYNFLKDSKAMSKELYFLESTDPVALQSSLRKLNIDDTLFIVISKSGSTIETISIFKYILSIKKLDKSNLLIITEDDSKLNNYAKANDIYTFDIPKDVGGRFSVLSNVGLVPLYLCGVNIDELLKGAKDKYNSFFNKEEAYDILMKKARTYYEYRDTYNINALFSYSQLLEGFNKWYVQLWGESLGKIDENNSNQGLTPIGLLGPVDQHSFLQLIVQGKRDKTITFIKIKDFKDEIQIPNITLEGLEELDYINNLNFKHLINEQCDATIESVKQLKKDIPIDILVLEEISEWEISNLMFNYELLTSIVGQFL
mgnify:CR=1 FL=1